ncbi:MAG: BspA family leucine-rich repeat surface protein, partial [Ruminococcus flavefaciens]|nr:BspA family leucine-rich repeat surface protein [Ruminococcus flavefaciens]
MTTLLCVLLFLAELTSADSMAFAAPEKALSAQQPDEMGQGQSERVESEEAEILEEESGANSEERGMSEEIDSSEETDSKTPGTQENAAQEESTGETEAGEAMPEVQEGNTEETETQEGNTEETGTQESEIEKTETQEPVAEEIEESATQPADEATEGMAEDGADGMQIEAAQSIPLASDDIAGGVSQNITWVIDANGKLTVTGSGNSSRVWPWSDYKTSIRSAEIHWTGATYAGGMFNGCSNLTSLDVSDFDTQNITDMSGMFIDCSNLVNLDLGNFDTQNVTNMSNMFYGCSSLVNLNLSNFATQNVTNMAHMFAHCISLHNIDLSSFNTQNVTNMSQMFMDCISLGNIDLSGFDTQNVTDMSYMFGCSGVHSDPSSLRKIDLSSFDTQNVTDMSGMFWHCDSLEHLNVSSFDTRNVMDMSSMFGCCGNLDNLDLSNFNTQSVTDMSYMFAGCSNLTSLTLSSFNTQNVTNMHRMFLSCFSLGNIDLSSFDTQNVIDMSYMFGYCSSLTSLNLSSFDTRNAAAGTAFDGCYGLNTLWTPKAGQCSLPPTATDREVWQLSDGTIVQQDFTDLTHSIQVRKYRLSAQEPDEGSADDQLQYVRNLTQASLRNADAESKAAIQNAIYNLLFKAEYRPLRSEILGDTMTYTGTRDAVARWPIQNKDYGTQVFYGCSVTDARLGTVTYNTASAGCMSYACFATAYVYGTSGTSRTAITPTGDSVRDFIRSYADPGEQLRYDMPHSIVFLGEKSDGDGFYYINYDGGDDAAGHVYHDLYVASYARYADFAAKLAGYGSRLSIFDANYGSYYSQTAASAADVRSGRGAARIVTRLACPIEATVERNGEILDSRTPGAASFGTVAREGEEILFTLDYAPDYRLTVLGTGEGGMTLTLEYYDAAETLLDRRKFVDMPIRTETEIMSGGFDPQAAFVLYRSEGGTVMDAWGAGIGETVYGEDAIFRGDNQSGADHTRFITFDANGGTIGGESSAVLATDDHAMLTALPTAVRDGYTFKGWYTSPVHGVKVDETRIYMEDTTLYAQWEKAEDDNPGGNDAPGEDTEGEVPKEDIPEGGIPEGLWIAAIGDRIYTGRQVKPEVHVYDGRKRLKEGRDYTVGYRNHTKAADGSAAKAPTVTVKGKGNYSGTETATFTILPVSLTDSSVTAQDLIVAYNGKVQKKAVSVLFNGKKLSANKDYTVSYPALAEGVAGAYREAGTYEILLTAKAGGNFTGTRTVKLDITKATLLSKATVKKIPDQNYSGSAVMPKPTVTWKGNVLTENTDYTIAYENNTEVGTAAMILKGSG